MIISPPFLPAADTTSNNANALDPMMDLVDQYELAHGIYPIAFDRRWHTGSHLMPSTQNERVRAIADGEVIAYRVCQRAIDGGSGTPDSNAGFVLLKHTTETGDGRSITFYSLYMHLLELDGYLDLGVQVNSLPEYLRAPTPDDGQSGGGRKVYRKDVLGLPGRCHGQMHIHFEIFMLPGDFDAYFGGTQLDSKGPETATGKDYWGHTYYIIPADQTFLAKPPGTDNHNKLHGVLFEPLQGGTNQGGALHVESYFHKGSKYTSTWQVGGDGVRALLTPQPVKEADYEYDMFTRATKLYDDCPSDGYELLRFGRILADQPVLADSVANTPSGITPGVPGNPHPISAPSPRTTWMRVTFSQGQEGYIDVNADSIIKLSDADFPFFTGWQKISEGNTPFTDDGMCDIDQLRKIVDDVAPQPTDPNESVNEDMLTRYVRENAAIRGKLREFICEAPTEWDSAHNDVRYAKLNEPDGFYGKQKNTNPDGYHDFLELLKKFQFWDKTGLSEDKLWFFHPLQFIRHFRKCGWLSMKEFEQIYSDARYSPHKRPHAPQLRSTYLLPLNLAARKYGLTSSARLAHFLGQGAVESGWLGSMQETSMLGHLDAIGFHGTSENPASTASESDLGHWYGAVPSEDDAWFRSKKYNSHGGLITGSYDWKLGNCDREDAQKFRGRGFKQLTGRSNYADYWLFRGWLKKTDFSPHWWDDPAYHARNRNSMTRQPAIIDAPQRVALPENCIDSGGFYLRCERPGVAKEIDADSPEAAETEELKHVEFAISQQVTRAINGALLADRERWEDTRAAKKILS